MAIDLYKIVTQLTEEEFDEIYANFVNSKADKSALFLKIIRDNPHTPDKEFLEKQDATSHSAFYVLKSRLNEKIETYLLNRVGDDDLPILKRVLNTYELIYNNPREISITALRRLEKELVRFDFPYGLMIVYKGLQNMFIYDEQKYDYYKSRYTQQVSYALALNEATDLVIQFFTVFDSYYSARKERDLQELAKIVKRIIKVSEAYDSHRLYILKSIVCLSHSLLIDLPEEQRLKVEEMEGMFTKAFEILSEYSDDGLYKNLNLIFDYLRFSFYDYCGNIERSRIYFEILDYKIEELITGYHFNVNTSFILFHKLRYHIQNNTLRELLYDAENFLSGIEVDPYRLTYFVNYHLFHAHVQFLNRDYKKASRILYNLRNEVNLRKHVHLSLETKFFLALSYVMMDDFDLANQLILSLQRQLRNNKALNYKHCKFLLRVFSVYLGGKPHTKEKNLQNYIGKWEETNVGAYAMLKEIDMRKLFLGKIRSR